MDLSDWRVSTVTFRETVRRGLAENFSVLRGYRYATSPPSRFSTSVYFIRTRFSLRGSMGKMRTLNNPWPAYSSRAGSFIRRTMSS